ncbi:sterol desaturase family protein [Pseudenhygromyxa sp. WMMC2535]|uniref:sterol desaturase family protein n=1 Tax=Pseudenhygromyxa sp. WMMC2535 TaxID=2712867 RepID=UPI0015558CBC|nr:sterol desaturase family protein [Pseudenhygromyxa sp. WMMC2535]NVB39926.1 sterol desaturase family protein [Pseudenhygromyxa sp. WMMC2535]
MTLELILFVVLAASGLTMVGLHYAYESQLTDAIKIYPKRAKRFTLARRARNILLNGLYSGGAAVGVSLLLRDFLFDEGPNAALTVAWQAVAVLALYDLLYYFMHRFLFHEWKWLRDVHLVHHSHKFPTAFESLYASPIEMLAGVVLVMACVAIVGPISLPAFAIVFTVFSIFNVVIHSGLDFKHPLLRPFAYLNRKHARHHASMKAGNFASISPLPDILFGTAE